MAVGIPFSVDDLIAVTVFIRTAVPLLIAIAIEQVFACSGIVQVNGIDGSDVTAEIERVGNRAGSRTIGCVVILMGNCNVQTCLKPLLRLKIGRYTCRQAVETRTLHISILVEIT